MSYEWRGTTYHKFNGDGSGSCTPNCACHCDCNPSSPPSPPPTAAGPSVLELTGAESGINFDAGGGTPPIKMIASNGKLTVSSKVSAHEVVTSSGVTLSDLAAQLGNLSALIESNEVVIIAQQAEIDETVAELEALEAHVGHGHDQ